MKSQILLFALRELITRLMGLLVLKSVQIKQKLHNPHESPIVECLQWTKSEKEQTTT